MKPIEMYAVINIRGEGFLNYAKKKKGIFKKNIRYYVIHSPYPTLRPKQHIKKHLKKWIENTPNPSDYKIIKFTCSEVSRWI